MELLDKLRNLRTALAAEIIGQVHVIDPVVDVLTRGELELTDAKRPRGSFLFVGPSGVGKTELVLVFSRVLMGEQHVARFDMSEFQLQESADLMMSRFGRLLDRRDKWVILIDEVEKGHPLVKDLFLQILDAGRLTLANDKVLNFSKCYIVFTSNIGARAAMKMTMVDDYTFQKSILDRVQREFRPEFFARINVKLVFKKLDETDQFKIADFMIRRTLLRLAEKGFHLEMSDAGRQLIINDGIDIAQGARPLRGVTDNYVESAVSRAYLAGEPTSGVLVPLKPPLTGLQITARGQ